MKTDVVPSVQIDCETITARICSNGVFIRRDTSSDGSAFCYGAPGAAVFRDPAEFGKWCADWMSKQLAKTQR